MSSTHHSFDIPVALVGGFLASFLTFAVTAYNQTGQSFLGQLLAGDPVSNQEFPTTLGTMQASIGGDPLISSMSSFGWWVAVMVGGLIAATVILKMMRRYV
jgi:hypothetical protein